MTEDNSVRRIVRKKAAGGGVSLMASLTPRQAEIVRLVVAGHHCKVIAHRLGVAEVTVKVHLHTVYRKFNVRNRLALIGLMRSSHSIVVDR